MNKYFMAVIGLLSVGALSFGTVKAFEIKYETMADTQQTPTEFLATPVDITLQGEIVDVTSYEELGFTIDEGATIEGGLFNRHRVHEYTEGNVPQTIVNQTILENTQELSQPYINYQWEVVQGVEQIVTTVKYNISDARTIDMMVSKTQPGSVEPLNDFIELRKSIMNGWVINLNTPEGDTLRWFDPEEIAPFLVFNSEKLTVSVDETIREELETKLFTFKTTGTLARYEFQGNGNLEPAMEDGALVVVEQTISAEGGTHADIEQAWKDFQIAVATQTENVAILNIDDETVDVTGFDPTALTTKLSEVQVVNTGGARMTNIRIALETLNGTVVMPGEIVSLNNLLGERTTAKGYLESGVIISGKHGTAVGGGISQTATLLHQASFFAGLEIPKYSPYSTDLENPYPQPFGHSEYFSRYQQQGYGVEQTVDWGSRDAWAINNTDHPIMLWTDYAGDYVTLSFWSTEKTQYGVWEGTDQYERGSCTDWTVHRTVYDITDIEIFSDEFSGYYRHNGPTCR